jgi:putative spermidine/putrescine transport system permease protein
LIRGFAMQVLLIPGGFVQRILATLHVVGSATDIAHSTAGLLIGMSAVMLPYMVFPITASLMSIDPALERAASSLGANGWQVFTKVTFPLSLPGVIAGSLLVFLITVGFYILPTLLGSPADTMLSQVIFVQVSTILDWGMAGAMSVILVIVTMTVFIAYARIFGLNSLSGTR